MFYILLITICIKVNTPILEKNKYFPYWVLYNTCIEYLNLKILFK